jgi:hypothetical protein
MSSPPLTDAGRDCSVPKDLGIPLRRRYQGGATRMLDQSRRQFLTRRGGWVAGDGSSAAAGDSAEWAGPQRFDELAHHHLHELVRHCRMPHAGPVDGSLIQGRRYALIFASRALPRFESYAAFERAAFFGLKSKAGN